MQEDDFDHLLQDILAENIEKVELVSALESMLHTYHDSGELPGIMVITYDGETVGYMDSGLETPSAVYMTAVAQHMLLENIEEDDEPEADD